MTEKIVTIPARLKSGVVDGHVTGTADIIDDSVGKTQDVINNEVSTAIGDDSTGGTIKGRIKSLETLVGTTPVDTQIDNKINALDSTVSQSAGADGLALSVTETNGKLTAISGSIAAKTYDAFGSAATVKTELLGDAASDYNTLGKLEDKIQQEVSDRAAAIVSAVNALDSTKSQSASTDGLALSITETDGKITSISGSIAAETYDDYGSAAAAKRELLGDAASDYNTLGKLEDKIQAEASTRSSADNAIDGRLDTLEDTVGTGGPIDTRIANAKSEIIGDAATAYNTLGKVEDKIQEEAATRGNADTALDNRLDTVESLIPSQATSSNQLADKDFVNSSISTATATYRGSKNSVSDLSLAVDATHEQIETALATVIAVADNNDYCFVQIPTSASTPAEISTVERYKYNGASWKFEYALNNSGFTAVQWKAINSGITEELVTAFNAKYDKPSDGIPSTDMTAAVQESLNKADSAYQKPSSGIPSADMSSEVQSSLSLADSAYQKPDTGIVKTDLNSDIQASLDKADTALQAVDIEGKADKSATVSNVSYDAADKKITQTINSNTTDVVTAGTLKTAMELDNVVNIDQSKAAKSFVENNGTVTFTCLDETAGTFSIPTYTEFVPSGEEAASGLVPAPPTTEGSDKYLCEDGIWRKPYETSYNLPIASDITLGGIKVKDDFDIDSKGVLSIHFADSSTCESIIDELI